MSEKDNTKKPSVLENYGKDITKLAKEGKLDPVIGRDKEIKRLGQILSRRKKNNAILVGYPGVGKTVVVQGLAQKIFLQECSPLLYNKRIIELDLASVVAGTKYRGQFEERLKNIMKEVEENQEIILFIDEIHNIIGAGSASGSSDASNIIKPALSSGQMQLIGATTLDEFRQYIEKDGALSRRFQKVLINAPTVEQTVKILKQNKEIYEKHHSVSYSDDVIEEIVKLADRYLPDKEFPDKALDIVDEVGSYVCGEKMIAELPAEISKKEDELIILQLEKKEIIKLQQYEDAALIRDKEKTLGEEIKVLKSDWLKKIKEKKSRIKIEDVAIIVSAMSGIPVTKLSNNEHHLLTTLESDLNSVIIGQQKAVEATVKEIQKQRLGIKEPNKPSCLLYVGQSGSGKTELAKALAKYYFQDEEALIRIDMNEYMEKFTVQRLTGAPPGYTGYDAGGELTNKIRNKPYCVVLLDEIEKAHPDVLNLFLQALEEGFLTDSQGFKADFRNVIFIMTSNIGTRKVTQFGKGIGYNKTGVLNAVEAESIVMKEVSNSIKVELIGRIDEIIVFNTLTTENLYQIIEINLYGLKKRTSDLFNLVITDSVKDLLIKEGYSEKYGARELRGCISKLLQNPLVDLMLKGIKKGSTVQADVINNKITYEIL